MAEEANEKEPIVIVEKKEGNPIIDHLKDRLNPVTQNPLRPSSPKVKFAPAPGPIITAKRPMPPAPPVGLPNAKKRGVPYAVQPPVTPPTRFAKELAEKAKLGGPKPRLCGECGGTKMVNVERNMKGRIIAFAACPVCAR